MNHIRIATPERPNSCVQDAILFAVATNAHFHVVWSGAEGLEFFRTRGKVQVRDPRPIPIEFDRLSPSP